MRLATQVGGFVVGFAPEDVEVVEAPDVDDIDARFLDEGGDTAGGLVHEPSPGEARPEGYVDSHAEQEHTHRIDGRPDPEVTPPIE